MVSAAVAVMGTANQSNAQGINSTSKTVNSSVNFAKVMSASLSSGVKSQNTANQTKASDMSKTGVNQTNEYTSKSDDVQKSAQTIGAEKNQKVDTQNNMDSSAVKDQLEELAEDVKNQLQEKFGVSDEELEDAMSLLGLGLMDLLQLDKLTQLVAAVNGQSDTLSILVNEDLSSGLQDLLGFIDEQLTQMSDSLGISNEELSQMVAEFAKEQPAVGTEETFEVNPQDESQEKVTEIVGKTEEPMETDETQSQDKSETVADVLGSKTTVTNSNEQAGSESAFSKNQQGTKAGANVTEQPVVENLAQSITNSFEDMLAGMDEGIQAADIVRQVVDSVRVTSASQLQSIEVALNPENLGKVTMNVSSRNGVVTAQLIAENEQVKKALETQMVTLKERFDQQGLKVDAVEVTVQSHSFEANENLKGNDSEEQKNQKKSSGHISLDSLDDLDDSELSTEELRARDMIQNGVSSVEYSA
ncbi:MAG: flagellar hook-length control protein FliK [Lachnospira sp.]|nr:flagellar hook-length control protein FliK [Lachnospira sp.]